MERYPLTWPEGWKRAKARHSGRFSKRVFHQGQQPGQGYHRTTELSIADATSRILKELQAFGVEDGDAIISTNLKTRLDGLPYSAQKEPTDPGVAVYWKRPEDKTHKVMAIDLYDRVADNLAAIAATLEAMRSIERHGGAQILERAFTGFDALPAPEDFNWRSILQIKNGATLEDAKANYRRLGFERHPDHGGSDLMMSDLNKAWDQAQKELS